MMWSRRQLNHSLWILSPIYNDHLYDSPQLSFCLRVKFKMSLCGEGGSRTPSLLQLSQFSRLVPVPLSSLSNCHLHRCAQWTFLLDYVGLQDMWDSNPSTRQTVQCANHYTTYPIIKCCSILPNVLKLKPMEGLSLCTLDYYLQHVLCELLAIPHSSIASFTHLSGCALYCWLSKTRTQNKRTKIFRVAITPRANIKKP